MLVLKSLSALRRLTSFPVDAMLQEIGPMALIQRSDGTIFPTAPKKMKVQTVEMEWPPPIARQALALLLDVGDGWVVPLGASSPDGEAVFGRGEDCDVRLTDPSVSARHASIRWDAWKRSAWVKDLGSTNGTMVNGRSVTNEVQLAEGNVVSMGDGSAFLFLPTETLYALLKQR